MLICSDMAAFDAKITHLQRTLDKVYAHERLMELRQYEQIHCDYSLYFGDLTIKP